MATIKSYTDLEQSKVLTEILPLESADMDYIPVVNIDGEYSISVNVWNNDHVIEEGWIPCWSLAALIDVLPEGIIEKWYAPNLQKENGKYSIAYGNEELLCVADNPIDACVEMIIKLSELKIL